MPCLLLSARIRGLETLKASFLIIVRLIRTISLHFIVESQTWYQNDRGVMLISNQSDAKIIGLGSRVIIGLNWP